MLQWVFGYCRNAQLINGMSWPDIPQTSVPRGFNSDIKDLGFLSIDVDHFRIGLSFLKAQALQQLHGKSTQGGDLASGVIKSHHLVFGSKVAFSWKRYPFLFGKARPIKITDLGTWLETFTRKPYVLIVHEGKQELSLLSLLNIKLEPVFILDTKQLLEEFEMPYSHLHIAGNDAHLTLRVLLMIAVRDAEIHLEGKSLPDWIPVLRAVAQSPLTPRPPTKREKAAMAEVEAERQTPIEAKGT
ncbi:hypothetical protein DER46DRAFT_629662 [Fusarium sp. MPI-SDFR-AT-0072]|nr:hypothetical protein DER46DRAFT_629662 [Fusarium sp. MPI-SDFR-AT-0072]